MLTDHPGLGEEGGWLRISPPCVETVVVRSRVRALRGDLGLFLCLYPANPVGGQISPQIRNTCREMSHKHRHSKHTERYRLSRPQTCVQMNDICSRYNSPPRLQWSSRALLSGSILRAVPCWRLTPIVASWVPWWGTRCSSLMVCRGWAMVYRYIKRNY